MRGALLLADRAVVGAGEHGGSTARGAGLGHDLRGAAGERRGAGHGIRRGDGVGPPSAASTRSSQISLSRVVSRSASRRLLENTRVEVCSATRSTMRSSTCGQIEARCS